MTATAKTPKLPKLTPLDALEQAAECLKTLAHPHRLRMIQMLLRGRYTVGELAEACGIPSHMASEHLRLMQRCGLLKGEIVVHCLEGKVAYTAFDKTHTLEAGKLLYLPTGEPHSVKGIEDASLLLTILLPKH